MSFIQSLIDNTPDSLPAPKGVQNLVVSRAYFGPTKGGTQDNPKPKRPMITVHFGVADQDCDEISDFLVFPLSETDEASVIRLMNKHIKAFLLGCGIDGENFQDIPVDNYSPEMEEPIELNWAGATCWAQIKHEIRDGETFAQVEKYLKPNEKVSPAPAATEFTGPKA